MASLSLVRINSLRPANRVYRVADGEGLCIEVRPVGSKLWRYRYRFNGKANMLALGKWPSVSLKEARVLRADASKALSDGHDPSAATRAKRAARKRAANLGLSSELAAESFEAIAREWLAQQSKKLASITFEKNKWMLATFVFPYIGARIISEIQAPEILSLLRRIEAKGANETAHRTMSLCSRVFRYAVATGPAHRDPTADLRGALASVQTKSHAAITEPKEIGELLRKIDSYVGTKTTRAAMRIAPLVFVRPVELRQAEWKELDFDAAEWRIPAGKMKMRRAHIVPLSTQAVVLFREIQAAGGKSKYVFPGSQNENRPMCENTVSLALRRMGYTSAQMTWHGFRTLASTRLNELGFSPDLIERQLAHKEKNKVRAVYNLAEYLDGRRKMMQSWADYLDTLRSGGSNVVPIKLKRPSASA